MANPQTDSSATLPGTRPHLSIVVPVYGCSRCLVELLARLDAALAPLPGDFQLILINDNSPDDAWQTVQELASKDPRVLGLNLSRNWGQHAAITAGIDRANGDWVVVMDCDLQDRPEEIPKLYAKAQEGYHMVVGLRAKRRDGPLKTLASKAFYKVFNYFTGAQIDGRVSSFGIYSAAVVAAVRQMKEQARSFGLFAHWVGFSRAEIEIEHASRAEGESTYTFAKMAQLAMDSIVAHSNKLLELTITLGFGMAALSVVATILLIIKYAFTGVTPLGWTSLMVSIYFTAGLTIGCVGVVGVYVGKIFNEAKGRPLYLVESTTEGLHDSADTSERG